MQTGTPNGSKGNLIEMPASRVRHSFKKHETDQRYRTMMKMARKMVSPYDRRNDRKDQRLQNEENDCT
jgi:hypothetical protein